MLERDVSLEELLRGILLGVLLPAVALALGTLAFPEPPATVQLIQLGHAYLGFVLVPVGLCYVALHLAQTLDLRWAWRKLKSEWVAIREPSGRRTWAWLGLASAAASVPVLAFCVPLHLSYAAIDPSKAANTRLLIAFLLVIGNGLALGSTAAVLALRRHGLKSLNVSWLCLAAAIACAVSGLLATASSPAPHGYVDVGWIVHVASGLSCVGLGALHVVRSRRTSARRLSPSPSRRYRWRRPVFAVALPVAALSCAAALFLPLRDGRRFPALAVDPRLVKPVDAHFAELAPASCQPCHAEETESWKLSAHAHAAANPVFEALLRRAYRDQRPDVARHCLGCHAPHALDPERFVIDEVVASAGFGAGVQCITCHRADDVSGTGDGTFSVRPLASDTFTFLHERPGELGERMRHAYAPYALVMSRLPLHHRAFRFHSAEPGLCRPCHVQTLGVPTHGNLHESLQDQFTSWMASPAAAAGKDCQHCHMPVYRDPIGDRAVDHRMLGASTYLAGVASGASGIELVSEALRGEQRLLPQAFFDRSREPSGPLLVMEAELGGDPGARRVRFRTRNSGKIGHSFPNGPTDLFEVWLAARITEAGNGRELLSVGMATPAGAPRLGDQLLDARGALIADHRLWDVSRVVNLGRIPALGDHDVELALPPGPASDGPILVQAAWKYRRLRPDLVEALTGKPVNLPIVDMVRIEAHLGARSTQPPP